MGEKFGTTKTFVHLHARHVGCVGTGRNLGSPAIDAFSAGNTHADVASVVRHTTLLYVNLVIPDYSSFQRRGTFDISKAKHFFIQYIFQEVYIFGIIHSSSKSS